MPNAFINPNWHVLCVHCPIGLLTAGVLLELFSCCWPKSTLRTAGRWMILLGALSLLPAATLGLYALRGVITGGPIDDEQTWQQVMQASPWSAVQWQYMKWHVLLMAVATGLSLLGVLVWLGASDEGRRKLRWPVLLIVLAGFGVMAGGAWYSGEAVYRHGTAVVHASPAPGTLPAEGIHAASEQSTGVDYYLPPLQLHLLLAGLTVALAVGAIGVSLRRWSCPPAADVPAELDEMLPGTSLAAAPPTPDAPAVYPARFWLLAFLLAAGTAAVGLWVSNDWKLNGLLEPLRDSARRAEMQRTFYHVIVGSSTVVLTFLLALITRVSRRAKAVTLFFVLLLLLAVAAQVWLGVLLLFDTDHGPLMGANT